MKIYHEKSLLHQLELWDQLLLLYLQLLHSLAWFSTILATIFRIAGIGLHEMSLLQEIDLQLLLKLMHQLFQLFASCISQLLK